LPRVAEAPALGYIPGMTQPPAAPTHQPQPQGFPDWPNHPEIEARQSRNLLLLACHQIVLRVGWIFKTESVIMPAFLDQVAGAVGQATGTGWIRGFLPVLNRFGQSVPPVFTANLLRRMRLKKAALALCAGLMSLPFLGMSAVWFAVGGRPRPWMPWLFLGAYFAFFVAYGLYLLAFGTVQGKLIQASRRGRLLLISTFWGAFPAAAVAWWLLSRWLIPSPHWGYVFAFVGGAFFLSSLITLALFEPADDEPAARIPRPGSLAETLAMLKGDANLRRLVLATILFSSGLIIFPHYPALARIRLGLGGMQLMIWVVTQNISVALFSLLVGPLADRRGYRLTLRLLIFGSAFAPMVAMWLADLPDSHGAWLFWTVFVPLGATPLVLRCLLNYALEICQPGQHPRYLSIVSLGLAVPFLLSPAVGWLVDVSGFEAVFSGAACMILLSGAMTFRLDEPRHQVRGETLAVGPED
jgi:hypothetical protein